MDGLRTNQGKRLIITFNFDIYLTAYNGEKDVSGFLKIRTIPCLY